MEAMHPSIRFSLWREGTEVPSRQQWASSADRDRPKASPQDGLAEHVRCIVGRARIAHGHLQAVGADTDLPDTRTSLECQGDQLVDDARRVVGLGDTLEQRVGVQGVVGAEPFAVEPVGTVEPCSLR